MLFFIDICVINRPVSQNKLKEKTGMHLKNLLIKNYQEF